MLVKTATAVTGQNQIARLGMKSSKKTVIIKSSLHTEEMDRVFVVVEPLKENGTVALVWANAMNSITRITKVTVPEEVRKEFS